jgi:SET domain-containing protein
MLLVPTKIGPSKIHGIGLFAAKPIKKGTVVWGLVPEIDIVLTPAILKRLSSVAYEQIMAYAYQDNKTKEIILCGDDARFMNHSEDANIMDNPKNRNESLAIHDISLGEELTCDYSRFDLLTERHLHRRKS